MNQNTLSGPQHLLSLDLGLSQRVSLSPRMTAETVLQKDLSQAMFSVLLQSCLPRVPSLLFFTVLARKEI